MPLPVIAIVVASVSATFTGANMLLSTLTYRRGGARLKVYASRLPLNPIRAYKAGRRSLLEPAIHVHVVNMSATSVTIERVIIDPMRRIPKWIDRLLTGNVVYPYFEEIPILATFVEGEEKKSLLPFEGARWTLRERRTFPRLPRRARWLLSGEPRVAVMLTNGEVFRSGKVANWRTRLYTRMVHASFRRISGMSEVLMGFPSERQASLDQATDEAGD